MLKKTKTKSNLNSHRVFGDWKQAAASAGKEDGLRSRASALLTATVYVKTISCLWTDRKESIPMQMEHCCTNAMDLVWWCSTTGFWWSSQYDARSQVSDTEGKCYRPKKKTVCQTSNMKKEHLLQACQLNDNLWHKFSLVVARKFSSSLHNLQCTPAFMLKTRVSIWLINKKNWLSWQ